jgi:hypothetical protein
MRLAKQECGIHITEGKDPENLIWRHAYASGYLPNSIVTSGVIQGLLILTVIFHRPNYCLDVAYTVQRERRSTKVDSGMGAVMLPVTDMCQRSTDGNIPFVLIPL